MFSLYLCSSETELTGMAIASGRRSWLFSFGFTEGLLPSYPVFWLTRVWDSVRTYSRMMLRFEDPTNGWALNICSGKVSKKCYPSSNILFLNYTFSYPLSAIKNALRTQPQCVYSKLESPFLTCEISTDRMKKPYAKQLVVCPSEGWFSLKYSLQQIIMGTCTHQLVV